MTTSEQLLAACWTSAGNVVPFRTGEESPVEIGDRVRLAGQAGYSGFGIGHADLMVVERTIGLATFSDMLLENGLETLQIEFLDYWWAVGDQRRISDQVRADLMRVAESVSVDHVKIGTGQAGDLVDLDRLVVEFGNLADDARDAGTRVALEAGAFSAVPRIEDAAAIVASADHSHGGILVDIWHVYRGGSSYTSMADALPADKIFAVELDDGWARSDGDLLADTFDNRVPCGSGDFGVTEFIKSIRGLGYDGPWGVEMMSHEHRASPVGVALAVARDAARMCLERAES